MLRRRDDEDPLARDELAHPIDGLLQQGAVADEIQELLRLAAAR
jgi:hypothetical protein